MSYPQTILKKNLKRIEKTNLNVLGLYRNDIPSAAVEHET